MNKRHWKDYAWGYTMILPLLLGLGVFCVYPFIRVIFDSFHNVGRFNISSWCGLENYKKLLTDQVFWKSLGNTFKYVIVIVPIVSSLALIFATLLNRGLKGTSFFRLVYYIPCITMSTAVAMVWRWIYNGDYGILNAFLNLFGIASQSFLTDQDKALLAISVVTIWQLTGYYMIILLAGLQGIPKNYYEAAELDGAGSIMQFFRITLPLISPSLFFVLITSIISVFQLFDTIYMMIPDYGLALEETQSIVVYFYRVAYSYMQKGYASAIAIALFVVIMLATLIQMKLQSKWVNYD